MEFRGQAVGEHGLHGVIRWIAYFHDTGGERGVKVHVADVADSQVPHLTVVGTGHGADLHLHTAVPGRPFRVSVVGGEHQAVLPSLADIFQLFKVGFVIGGISEVLGVAGAQNTAISGEDRGGFGIAAVILDFLPCHVTNLFIHLESDGRGGAEQQIRLLKGHRLMGSVDARAVGDGHH